MTVPAWSAGGLRLRPTTVGAATWCSAEETLYQNRFSLRLGTGQEMAAANRLREPLTIYPAAIKPGFSGRAPAGGRGRPSTATRTERSAGRLTAN